MASLNPASFLRCAVRAKLQELIAAKTDVPISRVIDMRLVQTEQIYMLSPLGSAENVVFLGQQLPLDDKFQFTVICQAGVPGQSDVDAEERAERIADYVLAALDDPTLGAVTFENGSLLLIVVGAIDGPHAEATEVGFVGVMSVDVSCHTRTTYQ